MQSMPIALNPKRSHRHPIQQPFASRQCGCLIRIDMATLRLAPSYLLVPRPRQCPTVSLVAPIHRAAPNDQSDEHFHKLRLVRALCPIRPCLCGIIPLVLLPLDEIVDAELVITALLRLKAERDTDVPGRMTRRSQVGALVVSGCEVFGRASRAGVAARTRGDEVVVACLVHPGGGGDLFLHGMMRGVCLQSVGACGCLAVMCLAPNELARSVLGVGRVDGCKLESLGEVRTLERCMEVARKMGLDFDCAIYGCVSCVLRFRKVGRQFWK